MGLFLFVTFVWSWGLVAVAYATGWVTLPFAGTDAKAILLLTAFMCGPMIGALVASISEGGVLSKLRLSLRPNLWWARAWAFPVALSLLALAATLFVPGVTLGRPSDVLSALPEAQRAALPATGLTLDALIVFQAVVIGAAINSVVLLIEELGWRGYMLSKLWGLGFWARHGLIGLVWGVWHIPVVAAGHNYPGEPLYGSLAFVVYCVLLSPVIGYFSERGKSVFAASIFHGTLNAVAPLTILVIGGVGVFERAIIGWPGFVLLLLCCVWLLLHPSETKTGERS